VRQPDEYAFARIEGAKLIPLGEIMRRMGRTRRLERINSAMQGGRAQRAGD
jgi:hypothetical protein